MNKIIEKKLSELSKSKFRSSFHLKEKDIKYIKKVGIKKLKDHTHDFIINKISSENPINDGKQTPFHGHPVFIAMHACGCCCRNCLFKCHHIEKGRNLKENEKNYIEILLLSWIKNEYINHNK